MKATHAKKYEYAAVCMPRDTKRKVRTIAAEMETSFGGTAQRLIEIGLDEYQKRQIRPMPARNKTL
jgi:hypothetical protein